VLYYAFPNRLSTKLWLYGMYLPYVCQNAGVIVVMPGLLPTLLCGMFPSNIWGWACVESK